MISLKHYLNYLMVIFNSLQKLKTLIAPLFLVFLLTPFTIHADEIQMWVDEQGKKHFTNVSPPSHATQNVMVGQQKPLSRNQYTEVASDSILPIFKEIKYDGTNESLKKIIKKFAPMSNRNNTIASVICQQAYLALGDYASLSNLGSIRPKTYNAKLEQLLAEGGENSNICYAHIPPQEKKTYDGPVWEQNQLLKIDTSNYARKYQKEFIEAESCSTYQRVRNYRLAVEAKTNAGDPFFMVVLGELYRTGNLLEKNTRETIKLWQRAADSGYHDALNKMGLLNYGYERLDPNIKIKKNVITAFNYFKRAAAAGSITGMHHLANFYFYGEGTAKNNKNFLASMKESAELGFSPAQYTLGLMYKRGFEGIVPKNLEEGQTWLDRSAKTGGYNYIGDGFSSLITNHY